MFCVELWTCQNVGNSPNACGLRFWRSTWLSPSMVSRPSNQGHHLRYPYDESRASPGAWPSILLTRPPVGVPWIKMSGNIVPDHLRHICINPRFNDAPATSSLMDPCQPTTARSRGGSFKSLWWDSPNPELTTWGKGEMKLW